MLCNAVKISLIFRRILGPLVLGWAPKGPSLLLAKKRLVCIPDNSSWINGKGENGRINYFKLNLHESLGPGLDRTRICSQTRYRQRYKARIRQQVVSLCRYGITRASFKKETDWIEWKLLSISILNKNENATPELFATYIQNYANQECNWKCTLMFKYWVMHNSKSFTNVVTRKHMKAI